MNMAERAALFRQRASEIEQKASAARTEEMRRAWLILAEDWKKMADREELKFLVANQVKLVPEQKNDTPTPQHDEPGQRTEAAEDIEDAIRRLAQSVGR